VYLPDALAEVDPIKTVHGLMGQRKRWINGSYFAFEKVKKEIGNTNYCELALRLQVLFYDFLNVFIYFAPAIFFFTVHISMQAFKTDVLIQILMPIQASEHTNAQMLNFFVYTIDLLYALLLGTIIYYSLNTTSNQAIYKPYIYLVSTVLGLMAIAVLIVFLVDIIRGLT
jgi:cellulose synthase/poly-beta-1,6-N-acetylglucosamine synthase-like glycosyltransferase